MLEKGYLGDLQLKAFEDLIGGLPVGTPVNLYGPAMAGKTIMSYQLGFEVLQTGHNVLLIDTEGSDQTYEDLHPAYNKKYEVNSSFQRVDVRWTPVYKGEGKNQKPVDLSKFDIKLDKAIMQGKDVHVFVFPVREVTEVAALLGKPFDLDVSENGKFMIRPQPGWQTNPMMSALGQFIRQNNIGYIAFDSVTAVTTRQIGTEQQNLPARKQILDYLMSTVTTLMEKNNLAGAYVNHEGQPGNSNPFQKFVRPDPLAGAVVNYHIKYSIYINHKPNPRTPSIPTYEAPVREMWVARHPSREPWLRYAFVKLTSDGFVDQ